MDPHSLTDVGAKTGLYAGTGIRERV
jgi:hypothetical protein